MRFRARSDRESAPTRAARERAQRAEHELDEVRRRRPVVDHLADVIGAVNGHGLVAHVDRMRIPWEDFTGTNVTGLFGGNRLLYVIPPYTPWTALPVAASEVTSATFGILFRQPRLWSRPWGLERF